MEVAVGPLLWEYRVYIGYLVEVAVGPLLWLGGQGSWGEMCRTMLSHQSTAI